MSLNSWPVFSHSFPAPEPKLAGQLALTCEKLTCGNQFSDLADRPGSFWAALTSINLQFWSGLIFKSLLLLVQSQELILQYRLA